MDSQQHAELVRLVSDQSIQLHTMKGALSANTSFTKEVLDRLDNVQERQETFAVAIERMNTAHDSMLAGFPDGDVDGHRQYHQAVIEWRELRNKIVREALVKAGQAGLLAGAGILAAAIWQAFKISVKQ